MSQWILDSIETKRDMVKVKNVNTQVFRTFFIAFLQDAHVDNNVIVAITDKCGWTIDINTGNRRRFTPGKESPNTQTSSTNDLPEFLKKQS
jgi:hypothetical protein